jgi:hypothetical protein
MRASGGPLRSDACTTHVRPLGAGSFDRTTTYEYGIYLHMIHTIIREHVV